MNDSSAKAFARDYGALLDLLQSCPDVTKHGTPDRSEAETLALAVLDIQESAKVLAETWVPKLLNECKEPEEISNTLLDIREELRHILYHVRDPKFFRYLLDED